MNGLIGERMQQFSIFAWVSPQGKAFRNYDGEEDIFSRSGLGTADGKAANSPEELTAPDLPETYLCEFRPYRLVSSVVPKIKASGGMRGGGSAIGGTNPQTIQEAQTELTNLVNATSKSEVDIWIGTDIFGMSSKDGSWLTIELKDKKWLVEAGFHTMFQKQMRTTYKETFDNSITAIEEAFLAWMRGEVHQYWISTV